MAAPKQRADIAQLDARTMEHFRLPEGQLMKSTQISDFDTETKKKRKRRHPEELGDQDPHDDPDAPTIDKGGPPLDLHRPSGIQQLVRKDEGRSPHTSTQSPLPKRRKLGDH